MARGPTLSAARRQRPGPSPASPRPCPGTRPPSSRAASRRGPRIRAAFRNWVDEQTETVGLFVVSGGDNFPIHVAVPDTDALYAFVVDRLPNAWRSATYGPRSCTSTCAAGGGPAPSLGQNLGESSTGGVGPSPASARWGGRRAFLLKNAILGQIGVGCGALPGAGGVQHLATLMGPGCIRSATDRVADITRRGRSAAGPLRRTQRSRDHGQPTRAGPGTRPSRQHSTSRRQL